MSDDANEKMSLIEIDVFDRVTLARRAGTPIDVDALIVASELPPARQKALRHLLAVTDTLRGLGREMKTRVAAAIREDVAEPHIVDTRGTTEQK